MKNLNPVKLLLFIFPVLLLTYIFLHIAHEVIVEKEAGFDANAEKWMALHRNENLTSFFRFITNFGAYYFLLPAYILVVGYQYFHNKMRALIIAAWGIISAVSLFAVKAFFHRLRPTYTINGPVDGFSFPSGHSMSTFVFFGILAFLVNNTQWPFIFRYTIITLLALLCLAVGFSRIYLGAHFASDVIAGYCLGLVYVIILYRVFSNRSVKLHSQHKSITDHI